jgi:hypothetical protein
MPAITSPGKILKLWKKGSDEYLKAKKTKEFPANESFWSQKVNTGLGRLRKIATVGPKDPGEFVSARETTLTAMDKFRRLFKPQKGKDPDKSYYTRVCRLIIVVEKLDLETLDPSEDDPGFNTLDDINENEVDERDRANGEKTAPPSPEVVAPSTGTDAPTKPVNPKAPPAPPRRKEPEFKLDPEVSDEEVERFNARMKAIQAEVQKALTAKVAVPPEVKMLLSEGGTYGRKKNFTQGHLVLDRIEALLDPEKAAAKAPKTNGAVPPPSTEAEPSSDAAKWLRRSRISKANLDKAVQEKRPGVGQMITLYQFAEDRAEQAKFDGALTVLDKLDALLGIPVAPRDTPPDGDPKRVAFDQEYAPLKKDLDAVKALKPPTPEIAALKQQVLAANDEILKLSISKSYDPAKSKLADLKNRLDALLGKQKDLGSDEQKYTAKYNSKIKNGHATVLALRAPPDAVVRFREPYLKAHAAMVAQAKAPDLKQALALLGGVAAQLTALLDAIDADSGRQEKLGNKKSSIGKVFKGQLADIDKLPTGDALQFGKIQAAIAGDSDLKNSDGLKKLLAEAGQINASYTQVMQTGDPAGLLDLQNALRAGLASCEKLQKDHKQNSKSESDRKKFAQAEAIRQQFVAFQASLNSFGESLSFIDAKTSAGDDGSQAEAAHLLVSLLEGKASPAVKAIAAKRLEALSASMAKPTDTPDRQREVAQILGGEAEYKAAYAAFRPRFYETTTLPATNPSIVLLNKAVTEGHAAVLKQAKDKNFTAALEELRDLEAKVEKLMEAVGGGVSADKAKYEAAYSTIAPRHKRAKALKTVTAATAPLKKAYDEANSVLAGRVKTENYAAALALLPAFSTKLNALLAANQAATAAQMTLQEDQVKAAALFASGKTPAEVAEALGGKMKASIERQQRLGKMTDMLAASKTAENHKKAGLQNPAVARNTDNAKLLATRLINDAGEFELSALHLYPPDELIGSLGPQTGPHAKHVLKTLTKLRDEPELRNKLASIGRPSADNPACKMIRATLGLGPDVEVTEVHARQAALSSMLAELRQKDVGSCFGTGVAIRVHDFQPDRMLDDMKSLIETGTMTRTYQGKVIEVPVQTQTSTAGLKTAAKLNAAGEITASDGTKMKMHATPSVQAGLKGLGIPDGEHEAKVGEVLTEKRNLQLIDEVLKKLPNTISEATKKKLRASAVKKLTPGVNVRTMLSGLMVPPVVPNVAHKMAALADFDKLLPTVEVTPDDVLRGVAMKANGLNEIDLVAFEKLDARMKALQPKLQAVTDTAALSGTTPTLPPALKKEADEVEALNKKLAPKRAAHAKLQAQLSDGANAYVAQGDNRLLRAWEYGVTSLAERGISQTHTTVVNDATTAAFDEEMQDVIAGIQPVPGVDLNAIRDDLKAKYKELVKTKIQTGYDADVSASLSADGQSTRGAFFLYDTQGQSDPTKWIKLDDKTKYSGVVRGLVMLGWQELYANNPDQQLVNTSRTVADKMADKLGSEGFVAKAKGKLKSKPGYDSDAQEPWQIIQGDWEQDVLQVYYENDAVPTTAKTGTATSPKPANAKESLAFLTKCLTGMWTDIKDDVNANPDEANVTCDNSAHAFLLKPGNPKFRGLLEQIAAGKDSATAVAEFEAADKAKAQSQADTALAPGVKTKLCEAVGEQMGGAAWVSYLVTGIKDSPATKVSELAPAVADRYVTGIGPTIDAEVTKAKASAEAKGVAFDEGADRAKRVDDKKKYVTGLFAGAVASTILPPIETAQLDGAVTDILKKTKVPAVNEAAVKALVLQKLAAIDPDKASMGAIEKAVQEALKETDDAQKKTQKATPAIKTALIDKSLDRLGFTTVKGDWAKHLAKKLKNQNLASVADVGPALADAYAAGNSNFIESEVTEAEQKALAKGDATFNKNAFRAKRVASFKKNATDAFQIAVGDALPPPVATPYLDSMVVTVLQAIKVPSELQATVKTKTLEKLATIDADKASMADIEETVQAIFKQEAPDNEEAQDPDLGAKVNEALRGPMGVGQHANAADPALAQQLTGLLAEKHAADGPPGMVIADSNWGGGDHHTMFSMVVNPLTGLMEMWQMNEDGTAAKPLNQDTHAKTNWGVQTDAKQFGGV